MADDNEGLFSPEQEEWIKELVSGLQRQKGTSTSRRRQEGFSKKLLAFAKICTAKALKTNSYIYASAKVCYERVFCPPLCKFSTPLC